MKNFKTKEKRKRSNLYPSRLRHCWIDCLKSTERLSVLIDFLGPRRWNASGSCASPTLVVCIFLIRSCTLGRQTRTGPMNSEDRDGCREDVMKRCSQVCPSEPRHPRAWLAISKRSHLIGIWLQKSQSALLIHPIERNTLANKASTRRGELGHMFLYRCIYSQQERMLIQAQKMFGVQTGT